MQEVTETVLRAVKQAGVRAILAEGGLCNSQQYAWSCRDVKAACAQV